jgi:glycosyltransferase involved in cell wall biosynthesis
MSFFPKLSVVVGTFNRLEALKRCISSIIEQTRTPVIVYVTDAGSTDGTQEYLEAVACRQIVPFLVGKKLGQAKAYNDAFRHVRTRYVAWLSDDNEVVNNGLDIGAEILSRQPKVGMVGLKVRDVQGQFASAPYIGGISSIGVLNVNQGLLRTDILRKLGYFSEAFGFYGIDPDLTARVLYSGHDIVYTKAVALHHYREWATDKDSPAYAALQAHHKKSLELYQRKYAGFGEDDRRWELKKQLWGKLRTRLGKRYQLNSPDPRLGGLYRDWNNALMSRHISPLDPWLSFGRDFHLRQRVARKRLPAELPADPVVPGN